MTSYNGPGGGICPLLNTECTANEDGENQIAFYTCDRFTVQTPSLGFVDGLEKSASDTC